MCARWHRGYAYDRLADRLADIALESLSTSLYRARNVRVTTIMEDMVDFFTY